ncbi:MAG: hypothetical protein DLM70_13480 [Chloroflexi bacterium]|nr:MAG: hypothetical protein DLM70_13480 [Chloroflexota bacterium]
MHRWKLSREPIAYQGLFIASVNLLIGLFGLSIVTAVQVGLINIFMTAVLTVVVRQNVTPLASPQDHDCNKLTPEGT